MGLSESRLYGSRQKRRKRPIFLARLPERLNHDELFKPDSRRWLSLAPGQ